MKYSVHCSPLFSRCDTCFFFASFSKSALPVSICSAVSTIVPGAAAHALTDVKNNTAIPSERAKTRDFRTREASAASRLGAPRRSERVSDCEVRMTESYVTREKLDDRSDVQ